MTSEYVIGKVFEQLQPHLPGFKPRKKDESFARTITGGTQLIGVALVDHRPLLGFQAAGGAIVRPGPRPYVVAVANRLKATLPDLAASIQSALAASKLRYYEVRQPIDATGKLGDIEIRQFKL